MCRAEQRTAPLEAAAIEIHDIFRIVKWNAPV